MRSDIWRFPVGGSAPENTREAVRITRQTGHVQTPSVSPDGTHIVYISDNGGHANLWLANTDGSSHDITFETGPTASVGVPDWSPRGDLIAFVMNRGGQGGLWAVRPDDRASPYRSGLGTLLVKRWTLALLLPGGGAHGPGREATH